jgi:hypothetical protein
MFTSSLSTSYVMQKNRTLRKAVIKMSGSKEFATSLRKFKLVFLGEQSG